MTFSIYGIRIREISFGPFVGFPDCAHLSLTSVPAYYSCTNLKCSDKKTSKGQSFNATTHFGRIVTEQKRNEKDRIETKPWRCDDRVLLTSKRRFSHHHNVHRHTWMTFGHIRLRRHISNLRTLNACIKAEIFKRELH